MSSAIGEVNHGILDDDVLAPTGNPLMVANNQKVKGRKSLLDLFEIDPNSKKKTPHGEEMVGATVGKFDPKFAKFDPKTGYPLDPKTGYAVDPITNMKIDPVTNCFMDELTMLPIDPTSGFATDPHTGLMIDPEQEAIVAFQHRIQHVTLPQPSNHEGDIVQIGPNALPNRRIGREFEYLPGLKLPFKDIKLYRGIEETPEIGDKCIAGSVKANFEILSETRTQEGNVRPRLQARFQDSHLEVRVYVLHGYNLIGTPLRAERRRQRGNLYLRVKCGNTESRLRHYLNCEPTEEQVKEASMQEYDGKIKDGKMNVQVHASTMNPYFYTCLKIKVALPGASKLEVQIWDHVADISHHNDPKKKKKGDERIVGVRLSDILHDKLVGTTVIDLEKRWYSDDWQKMEYKPIESRNIWSPTSTHSQGKIECWVDMIPKEASKIQVPRHIAPPKPEVFEFRMIVWSVCNINFRHQRFRPSSFSDKAVATLKDFYLRCTMNMGNTSDARLSPLPGAKWKTSMFSDTHFGLPYDRKGKWSREYSKMYDDDEDLNGAEANFNWRFNWRVELPCQDPTIRLQLFDRMLASPETSRSCCALGKPPKDENARKELTKLGYALNEETDHWAEAVIDVGDLMRKALRTGGEVNYENWKDSDNQKAGKDTTDSSAMGLAYSVDKNTGNKTYEHDKTSPPCKVKLFHRHYAKSQGYAFVSLQCLPLSRATTLRAGQGRSEPNENVVGKCDVPGETVFCCIKNRWIQGLRSTFEFYRFIYRKEIKYAILAVVLVILLLISLAVVFSS